MPACIRSAPCEHALALANGSNDFRTAVIRLRGAVAIDDERGDPEA
jgi:hypothetical protein